jgi:putative oxidoreductase
VTEDDLVAIHPAIAIAGRVMFALIFLLSGVTHLTNLGDYVALMPAAIPFRTFWVMVSAVVELAGATLIVTNTRPRLGAWLIVIFLVPVTITVHGVGMMTAPDVQMRTIQTSFFLKGVALTGAALLITQLGAAGQPRTALRKASSSSAKG